MKSHYMTKKLPCLYTNQKTKKRKRWEDGTVAVHSSGLCTLHANNATALAALDSRFLSAAQAKQIIDGRLREIEFDGYLVEISEEASTPLSVHRNVLPQTVPKFRIPASRPSSKVSVSVGREDIDYPPVLSPIQNETTSSRGNGRYEVSEDELDSIWGPTHSTENHLFSKTLEEKKRVLPHQRKEFLNDTQERSTKSWNPNNSNFSATKDFVQLEDDSDEDVPPADIASRPPLHPPVQDAYGIASDEGDCFEFWGKPTFTL